MQRLKRGTTWRNPDKVDKQGAKVRGSSDKDGNWKCTRGQTESPEAPSLSPLPAPNPLNPHPKQDAVSMTTWLARKGGGGLQRKFSTSAGRKEGVMQRRKQPIQGGPCRAPGTPNHHARCPQDCHPAPIQQICTLTSGPLLGRGKAWERLKGQTSKEQQLPRSGVCVLGWGGEPASNSAQIADHQIPGHGPRQGPAEGGGSGLRPPG